jgi:hypothetical protein
LMHTEFNKPDRQEDDDAENAKYVEPCHFLLMRTALSYLVSAAANAENSS